MVRVTSSPRLVLVMGSLSLVLGASGARAADDLAGGDLATRWKVNEDDPRAGLPSIEERSQDPLEFAYLLQDLVARGERAFIRRDWKAAIKYYEALAHAVPDAGVSFNRLCVAYGELGLHAIAAGNCGRAVALPGARVIDHVRLIEHALKKPKFTEQDRDDLEQSLRHLREHLAKTPVEEPTLAGENGAAAPQQRTKEELIAAVRARQERKTLEAIAGRSEDRAERRRQFLPAEVELLECKLAVRLEDAPRLERCIQRLRELRVNEAQLAAIDWTMALMVKDEKKAERILASARTLGVPEPVLGAMQSQYETVFPRRLLPVLATSALGATLVVVLVGLWMMRNRRRRTERVAA